MQHVKEFSLMYTLSSFWHSTLYLNPKINFQPLLEHKNLELSLHQQQLIEDTKELQSDIPFLCFTDPLYPKILHTIPHMPPVLFYEGNLSLLDKRKVAIVGSRYCSQRAKQITHELSFTLGSGGHATISGLAFGIDEIAHRANLHGSIGILPFGFQSTLSSRHTKLCKDILDAGGLLLSEFPLQQPAQKWTFLQRNRIISGLAEVVVITEAQIQSGSLNTARHALDQKKEVFTIPWDPLHKEGSGCRMLLKKGVIPLLDLQEWSEEWGILSYLDERRSIEELIAQCNSPREIIVQALMTLLKSKQIVRNNDGTFVKS